MVDQPIRIDRTSAGLRDVLFDEIAAVRTGRSDPHRALAVSKLASQIIASAKVEHEVAKYRGSPNYEEGPLRLGGPDGPEA